MVHVSERAHYCLKGIGKREIWGEDPHPWLRIIDSRVLLTIPYFYLMFYLNSLILELFTKFCFQWSEFKGAWLVGLICSRFRIVAGFDHFAVTVHDRSLDMG